MRLALPFHVLRHLGRLRSRAPKERPPAAPDPADMGTDFALDASIAGWSDSFLGRGAGSAAPAAGSGLHDEPPMKWLDAAATRRR